MTLSPESFMAPSTDAKSSPTRNPTLEDAWQRFGDYDKNAVIAQKSFMWQRKWSIILGFAATTVAVMYLVLQTALAFPNEGLIQFLGRFINDDPTEAIRWIMGILEFVIVLIPIMVSVLLAVSVKFGMGVNWIMLRSGAESLKKEIYRYRIQVDIYSPDQCQSESRNIKLARKIKIVGQRVMETQVNQFGLTRYTGELPPPYGAAKDKGDDGFSDLTPDQYLAWRLEDQFDYYRRKAERLNKECAQFQWTIYTLGGVGTLLAATGFEVWVAVSSALASAIASFFEFKRVETNLTSCNQASSDLYDIRAWWRALPASAKAQSANLETLVKSTETVIQSENAGWVQEMRDALAEIYGDQEQTEAEDEQEVVESNLSLNAFMESESTENVVGEPTEESTQTESDERSPQTVAVQNIGSGSAQNPSLDENSTADKTTNGTAANEANPEAPDLHSQTP